MSSLEDEIFFGSKQNILDSYLRAREEQRDDSQPRRGAVVYPNILDEISYQRSFDRPQRFDKPDKPYFKQHSITIKSLKSVRLNDTVFVMVRNVKVQSDTLGEGVCLEMRVQLGESRMEELFFYSKEGMVDVKDCMKVSLVNCSLEEYFGSQKVKCMKLELVSKSSMYDQIIGSAFMPIESVITVLENFCSDNKPQIKKEVTLRVLSHKKIHGQNFLKFDFVVSRIAYQQPTPAQVFVKQQQALKQKAVIKIIEVSLKEGYERLCITYNNKEFDIQEQETFTIDINKDNQTLSSGITMVVLTDGKATGKISLPMLHLFLSETVRGKYPVNDLETEQYKGYIQMEISEPCIGYKPNKMTQMESAILGKTIKQSLITSAVVSLPEILIFSKDQTIIQRQFIAKCYKNTHARTSKHFTFVQTEKPLIYTSSIPIDFEYLSEPNSQKSTIVLEIYRKQAEDDYKMVGCSKIEVYGSNDEKVDIIDLTADCETMNKTEIVKVRMCIWRLVYRHGFFIEDKIQQATKLFYCSNRRKISQQQSYTLSELRQKIREVLGITFVEIDKILALASADEPLKSDFIKAYLKRDQIQTEQSINVTEIYKQVEYADNLKTGYIPIQQFKTILSYFRIYEPHLQRYIEKATQNIKDCIYQKRKFGQTEMVNYLLFIKQCRQKTGHTEKTEYELSLSQNLRTQSPTKEDISVQILILKGTNFNTLLESIKSPNAYIVEESLGFSTEVCYRNCNPEFFSHLSIKNHNSEFLNFRIMHKDFKTKDCQIGVFTFNLHQALRYKQNQIVKIKLNQQAQIQIQRK